MAAAEAPGAGWRALVQEISWAAVRRAGADHAELAWLPGVVDEKLGAYVGDEGVTELLYEEVVAWAAKLLSERPPTPRLRPAPAPAARGLARAFRR
jgi:hypothetical protein